MGEREREFAILYCLLFALVKCKSYILIDISISWNLTIPYLVASGCKFQFTTLKNSLHFCPLPLLPDLPVLSVNFQSKIHIETNVNNGGAVSAIETD